MSTVEPGVWPQPFIQEVVESEVIMIQHEVPSCFFSEYDPSTTDISVSDLIE